MNQIKITKEYNELWKEKIRSVEIPYYSRGNFKSTISDINESRKINTLSTFMKFIKETIDTYDNDLIYKTISNAISGQIPSIKTYYNNLITYLKNNNPPYIVSCINNIIGYINNYSYISTDSIVYQQMKSQEINNSEQIIGYLAYFRTITPNGDDQLFGYGQAFKVNDSSTIMGANISLGNAVKKIGNASQELWEAKENLVNEIDDQKKIVKSSVENFNSQFSEIKEEMVSYRNKLMLSGPLGIWYKRLSEYTGNNYKVNLEESRYEYDIEKQKWWHLKGKIRIYGFLSIIWSIVGIVLTAGVFWWIFHQIPNVITDHTKTTVIISVVTSFVLFVYGYILRIFIKNWNTSRHICEEIEERISLTQFYIALSQNEEFNHDEIALREIFKRIETGMIKEVAPRSSISSLINKKD